MSSAPAELIAAAEAKVKTPAGLKEERKLLGSDPWPIGVKTNYSNLERFIDYSHDQNLLNRRITVESLFPEQVLDT